MNKEKVLEVVKLILINKISNLIEEVSSNEFLEQVSTEVYDENEPPTDFDEEEKIKEIVGSKVIPLLLKMVKVVSSQEDKVIEVDISFYHPEDENGNVNETLKVYDVEGMREEFEYELNHLINGQE
jgi:hypothetical protein